MQDIDTSQMLKRMLNECESCSLYFFENASILCGDETGLTVEQVEWAIIHLNDYHNNEHVRKDIRSDSDA